ncbi:hypothetical protein [Parasphingopyxis lamellibrachiae]|uniref:Uncharacterized protein n=1 Tax=Parasphingopyxis lamellibrachiae TaxID=680125 RepID=A0A3D9FD65_9SPHN|nr:hypothetical protein [Parasphingopyxis lamellibrachiae]RED15719.1 hypothetical protein DFR46_0722 [Parasphingopyxis lamellibrachiae]
MPTRLKWIIGILGVVAVAGLAYVGSMQLGLADYRYESASDSESAEGDLAEMSSGERLCAAQSTIDSIRQRIFARARTASNDDGALLSRLEGGTLARMEEPRLIDFDEGLEQARCEGRLILELPRGTEPAFNYSRRLNASLEYIAEPTADGRGRVHRMNGADDLIDRLADADLVTRRSDPADKDEAEGGINEEGKDEFAPGDDEPVAEDPDFEGDDVRPPEELLPPVMQEDQGK